MSPEQFEKDQAAQARPQVDESMMKDWAGGAKRSKAMPSWNMLPWDAIKGVLTRFDIGKKYGINNWRKAQSVPREKWHDGEPGPGLGADDNSALGFVRQFVAHSFEHYTNAVELADASVGAVSDKGDDFMANLFAHGWNVLCLISYAIFNQDMVREALSQYPVGHPKRRQDLLHIPDASPPWIPVGSSVSSSLFERSHRMLQPGASDRFPLCGGKYKWVESELGFTCEHPSHSASDVDAVGSFANPVLAAESLQSPQPIYFCAEHWPLS